MKKKKVIKYSNLPRRMPLMPTLLWMLILRVYAVPEWVMGIAWLLLGLVWLVYINDLLFSEQEEVDLFEKANDNNKA